MVLGLVAWVWSPNGWLEISVLKGVGPTKWMVGWLVSVSTSPKIRKKGTHLCVSKFVGPSRLVSFLVSNKRKPS